MSTFEFIFSLFGLLLGFSLAELAGGFSRAYDRRKSMPIGWISPVLGALLIVDLLSFWYGAWFLRDMELKFWVVLVAAIVGLMYYFAATQVFPREGAHEAPTAHIMGRRKAILFSVVAANLVMFCPKYVMAALVGNTGLLLTSGFFITTIYLALVLVASISPSRAWVRDFRRDRSSTAESSAGIARMWWIG